MFESTSQRLLETKQNKNGSSHSNILFKHNFQVLTIAQWFIGTFALEPPSNCDNANFKNKTMITHREMMIRRDLLKRTIKETRL